MGHTEPSGPRSEPGSQNGHVLVLDAGSSSLHMVLFNPDGSVAARRDSDAAPGEHTRAELEEFLRQVPSPIAVGHRLVHGGSRLRRHALVDEDVRGRLDEAAAMAPLHVPAALTVLGGGCSACAVKAGRSTDTTMGFTPLEGLVMSHRSGTVDPGALLWLQQRHHLSAADVDDALNHHSGLLALSGTSGDTRDLVRDRAAGDERAALALDVFVHHCRRGIAAMGASLDRIDALVFTGEIGEDQPEIRHEVCAGLSTLAVSGELMTPEPDDVGKNAITLSAAGAAVPVLMVPTGEEDQVALETRALLHHADPAEPVRIR